MNFSDELFSTAAAAKQLINKTKQKKYRCHKSQKIKSWKAWQRYIRLYYHHLHNY